MHYRKLGSSGLKVSELSFGSWVTFHKQVDSKLAEQMFGICTERSQTIPEFTHAIGKGIAAGLATHAQLGVAGRPLLGWRWRSQ